MVDDDVDLTRFLDAVKILQTGDVRYWIDDGTLLGLVRDNELIASDRDIDIGIYYEHRDDLDGVVSDIEALGFNLEKRVFDGHVFGYSFRPNIENARPLNFKLFRRNDDHAWFPAPVKHEKTEFNPVLYRITMHLKYKLETWNNQRRYTTWPSQLYDFKTLWVPTEYYDSLTTLDKYDVAAPAQYESYLKFKYGDDWTEPTDDWNYLEDDGAIKDAHPYEIIQ